MNKLNSKSIRILLAMQEAQDSGGTQPSVSELMELLDVSQGLISKQWDKLEKLGLIKRDKRRVRARKPSCRFIPAESLAP